MLGSIILIAKCSYFMVCQTPTVFQLLIVVKESFVLNKLKTDKAEQNLILDVKLVAYWYILIIFNNPATKTKQIENFRRASKFVKNKIS